MVDKTIAFIIMSIWLLACALLFVISGIRQPRHNVEHFEKIIETFLILLVIYVAISYHIS